MNKEFIPLVDEHGKYLDKIVSRDRVHKEELWHPVVHIWVVNEDKELLLQKRADDKPQYGGVWHISAAGHIVTGENGEVVEPSVEAARETTEELGVVVKPEELQFLGGVGVSQIIPEDKVWDKEWINVFLLRVNKADLNLNLQEEEVQDTKWISLDKLLEDIDDEEGYKKYLNHPKSYYKETVEKIRETIH